MRPGRAISHRSFLYVASLGLVVSAIGCFHTDPVPANNDGGGSGGSGSGGSNSSGGSTGSGSGGSISGGSGGSTGSGGSISGGSGGSTGSGGSDVTGSGGTNAGSGGTAGGSGGASVGPVLPLPIIVTTVFDNQGWFGDAAVMTDFKPGSTVISQTEATDGPCAKRKADAKGKCLKVVYTPPTDVTLMAGGYVGVFFLTTIKANHPDATPPLNIGQPNWGAEPGVNIAPGATKISFWAAAPTAGLMVSFKAGAGDSFGVPATPEALTTAWASYSLPLTGQDYGTSVLGGFAWVVTDTMKPATFYLDGIIWE